MRYFLGIDIGDTKSHALIADERGSVCGVGIGGSGNHETVGWEGMARTLQAITNQALREAGLQAEQVAGAGFGVAGYDWPSQRESTLKAIATLGLRAPVEAVNDALLGVLAGTRSGWGVALTAGTSCNCWGWDRNHRVGRMSGMSWLLGEAAGGTELIDEAIRAVARAWSHRGRATALTQAFIARTGARNANDLLEGIALGRYHLSAADAPLVFEVAAAGDEVARAVIDWGGRELGSLAVGVIRQLGIERESFDVVLMGGLWKAGEQLVKPVAETIHAVAPEVRLVRLSAPPVVGSVLLGMELAGFAPGLVRDVLLSATCKRFGIAGTGIGEAGAG